MKLQSFSIIFILLIVPISLVLGYYTGLQVNTIKMQVNYDEKLSTATYDAIKAYQINTSNNPFSVINSSQKRDVEASINAFMGRFASGLGTSGYGEDYIKPYIPAMLYTLYDGYYIYAPTFNEKNNKIEYFVRPFTTYSQRYVNGSVNDVVISYTLDNFISVTGLVNGEYKNEAGYLLSNTSIDIVDDNLQERLFIYNGIDYIEKNGVRYYYIKDISGTVNWVSTGGDITTRTNEEIIHDGELKSYNYILVNGEKRYYDTTPDGKIQWYLYRDGRLTNFGVPSDDINATEDSTAKNYVTTAREFTEWVENNLSWITANSIKLTDDIEDRAKKDFFNELSANDRIFARGQNYEYEFSNFNKHKRDAIKIAIRENLLSAIANYNAHSESNGTTYAFSLPNMKEEEWDQITRNICMAVFVQGLPMGFKTYNSYAIVNNTKNKNYVDTDSLCFIERETNIYHKIDCPKLTGTIVNGYSRTEFDKTQIEISTQSFSKKQKLYYYKHDALPCYYCIVSRNYDKATLTLDKQKALNTVLARERMLRHIK